MNRNIIETVLGAVVLLAAAVFLSYATGTADKVESGGYKITADFNRTDGLKAGSDVRMNGVLVGMVSEIKLDMESYTAKVSFTVDPKIKLPRDTIAMIASESLLGGKYMSLEVGVDDEMVATDGTGRLTHTTPPMRLDDLIGQLIYKEDKNKDAQPSPVQSSPVFVPQDAMAPSVPAE